MKRIFAIREPRGLIALAEASAVMRQETAVFNRIVKAVKRLRSPLSRAEVCFALRPLLQVLPLTDQRGAVASLDEVNRKERKLAMNRHALAGSWQRWLPWNWARNVTLTPDQDALLKFYETEDCIESVTNAMKYRSFQLGRNNIKLVDEEVRNATDLRRKAARDYMAGIEKIPQIKNTLQRASVVMAYVNALSIVKDTIPDPNAELNVAASDPMRKAKIHGEYDGKVATAELAAWTKLLEVVDSLPTHYQAEPLSVLCQEEVLKSSFVKKSDALSAYNRLFAMVSDLGRTRPVFAAKLLTAMNNTVTAPREYRYPTYSPGMSEIEPFLFYSAALSGSKPIPSYRAAIAKLPNALREAVLKTES